MRQPSAAAVAALVFCKECYALMHSNVRNIFVIHHVSRTSLKSKSKWGIGENWSLLSSEAEDDSSSSSSWTAVHDQQLSDPVGLAAKVLEAAAEPRAETPDNVALTIGIIISSPAETDAFLDHGSVDNNSAAEQEAKEIGLLVRCNEIPDNLLVEEGRGLQPLSDNDKFDVAQLLLIVKNNTSEYNEHHLSTATKFFNESVFKIFQQHSTLEDTSGLLALNRDGVAKWMTKCLKDEEPVSKNDKRVLEVVSRFSTNGTGYLSQQEFLQLYTEVLQVDFDSSSGKFKRPSSRRMSSVEKIWRDFTAHSIQSPNEIEWNRKKNEVDNNNRVQEGNTPSRSNTQLLHDECEILEWNLNTASPHWSIDSQGVSNLRRGSHQLVELCIDGETPKRIRDGEFVFIDEESCIGCTQCVHAAPNSFMMLDTGRARTFHQSNAPDVASAVLTCPVNCMKFMSFQELRLLETVRDNGDGRDEDTNRRNMGHTPLYVAGIDSDANHKSSWYHTLKQSCSTSSNCPQKGCYDCPKYSTAGDNPYFKEKQVKAHLIRMKEFLESDEVNALRKIAEL